ncbi:MAG: nitroreductase family protein [Acidimicrobiales bacterium]|nr:nitroreductase family protein [Acidimicrobiales bacterium]
MELIDALRSTGAVRAFTDEPVDDATLHALLDTARFAPSGGNRQPWKVAVVRDLDTRRAMAALMRGVWHEYVGANATGVTAFAFGHSIDAPPIAAPNPLLDAIDSIPVVLAVAADLDSIAMMDGNLDRPPVTGGASIYPFCWSILLAARAHGLGGVLTTFLSRAEPAIAERLALPHHHALVATLFLGRPEHQNTKLTRHSVNSFATIDRFDGASFDA